MPPRALSICQVTEAAGGGVGRHVLDLTDHLSRRGHRVTLVYSDTRADADFLDRLDRTPLANRITVPMRRTIGVHDAVAAARLRDVLRRTGPYDVVHGHSSKAGALVRLGAPADTRRIYTPHALRTLDPTLRPVARLLYGGIERALARRMTDAVIAVSAAEFDHARALGIPGQKLVRIVNGVEAPPAADRAALRRELGLGPDDVAFGFVGRLTHQKAPDRFVEVMARLVRQFPAARGVMLGDGEAEPLVRSLIEQRALGGFVSLHSGLDAARYMQAFDVLMMTSRYEAMPYVLLEALAAGLPILTTPVGGTAELIEDGVNGFVVDSGGHDLTDRAARLMASPELRGRMARQSAVRGGEHSTSRMVDEIERVYFDLLDGLDPGARRAVSPCASRNPATRPSTTGMGTPVPDGRDGVLHRAD